MRSLPISQRLISGGFWVLSGRVVALLVGLMTTAILTRSLTVQEVGAYFLILSVVGVASSIGQVGLGQAALLLVARSLGEGRLVYAQQAARTIMLLGFCSAVAVSFSCWLIGGWLATDLFSSPLIQAFVWCLPLLTAASVMQGIGIETLRGFHDIRRATIWGVVISPVLIFLGVALARVFGNIDLSYVLQLNVLVASSLAILAIPFFVHRHLFLFRRELISFVAVMRVSLPLFVLALLGVVSQLDLWVVGWAFSEKDAAVYGACTRLVLLIAMPLTIANGFLPPIIAELHAKGERETLERVLRMSATLIGAPSLLALAILMSAPKFILGLVYGEQFQEGSTILVLLGIGHAVNVLSGSCGYVLVMSGHQALLMKLTLVSSVLAISLGVVLTKIWAVSGVAAAVALFMAIQNLMAMAMIKRKLRISTAFSFGYLSVKNLRELLRYKYGLP